MGRKNCKLNLFITVRTLLKMSCWVILMSKKLFDS